MINRISAMPYEQNFSVSGASKINGTSTPTDIVGSTGKIECQTCKSRKYQDGSNEMVSFKSAAHISPESSASVVRAHEQEHVSNAYRSASQKDGTVVQASVSLHTSVCPECGRAYVSGGTTTTQVKYKEDNPYSANAKSKDYLALAGNKVDLSM